MTIPINISRDPFGPGVDTAREMFELLLDDPYHDDDDVSSRCSVCQQGVGINAHRSDGDKFDRINHVNYKGTLEWQPWLRF